MRLLIFLGTMLAAFAAATPAPAGEEVSLVTELQATLDAFQKRYAFPGATAAIALPDGTVVTAATGLADVEAARPMTPDSRMLAASVGKTFVAATVLALESEGMLSRHDRVAAHLGDRSWFAALPNAGSMTIGQLLSHRAGLPDHVYMPAFREAFAARVAAGEGAFTPEQILGFLAGAKPLFAAGEGWAYSDTGYILLGLVIEAVTSQTYYELVQTTFLAPLDLEDTTPSDHRDIAGLAVGYTIPGNAFGLPERTADAGGALLWDPATEWTGGGLASTSRDLARWGRALYRGAALETPYLDRLLDAASVAPDAPDTLYGAGVTIYTKTAHGPVYGHGGWITGYVSSLRYYADRGVTVAFQINTDAGVVDDSSDLTSALESALADLAVGAR